jgi:hypothetical protein
MRVASATPESAAFTRRYATRSEPLVGRALKRPAKVNCRYAAKKRRRMKKGLEPDATSGFTMDE